MGWLTGPESLVSLTESEGTAVAEALVALGPTPSEPDLATALADALEVEGEDPVVLDLLWAIGVPLEEATRNTTATAGAQAMAARLALAPDAGLTRHLEGLLLDLAAPTAGVPDPGGETRLDWVVTGQPVMHRGLSRSVTANQFRSLGLALGLVAVMLSLAFRSPRAGLLATTPTAVTLLVIYGGMGAAGVHLDIGTSMLAGLVIGAGVDYAVHLQSAWVCTPFEELERAAGRAAARTGAAIWTNASMVAAGFFVLTLGEARPLRNVGGLTSAAMITAACVTFLAIPVLANRRRYVSRTEEFDPADPDFERAPG